MAAHLFAKMTGAHPSKSPSWDFINPKGRGARASTKHEWPHLFLKYNQYLARTGINRLLRQLLTIPLLCDNQYCSVGVVLEAASPNWTSSGHLRDCSMADTKIKSMSSEIYPSTRSYDDCSIHSGRYDMVLEWCSRQTQIGPHQITYEAIKHGRYAETSISSFHKP